MIGPFGIYGPSRTQKVGIIGSGYLILSILYYGHGRGYEVISAPLT